MYDHNTAYNTNNMTSENEIVYLRKQLRFQEVEYKKNKAVMEQKIEILELQNQEYKDREENLKKMNNSIMNAISDISKDNVFTQQKSLRELEFNNNQLTKELEETKTQLLESIKNLEKNNKELKEKISEMDIKYNQMVLKYEKSEFSYQQNIAHLENEKKNLEHVIKLYEDERKQYKDKENNQYDLHAKIGEFKFMIEKQKDEYKREIEKIHSEYSLTITNMKKIFDAEKVVIQSQMFKQEEATKQERKSIEELKESYTIELNTLKSQKDQALKKADNLEKQIQLLNSIIKTCEEKYTNTRKEKEDDQKEYTKLKERIIELEAQLKKFDNLEKTLKQDIAEKDHQIEEIRLDFRKKIAIEKKRFEQMQEAFRRYQEEITKKNALILQESLKKDETIKKLKNQVVSKSRETVSRVSKNQEITPIKNTQNTSMINNSVNVLKRDKESIHSNMQDEYSHTSTRIGLKIESPDMDITNDNILFSLNSPRIFQSTGTGRNTNDKKEYDYRSLPSQKKHYKDDKSLVIIQSNETNDIENNKSDEDQYYSKFKGKPDAIIEPPVNQLRNSSIISDVKKGGPISISIPISIPVPIQNDKQCVVNWTHHLFMESLKYISYVECQLCQGNFGLSDFLEHILSCVRSNSEKITGLNHHLSCENLMTSPYSQQNIVMDNNSLRCKSSLSGFISKDSNKKSQDGRSKELEDKLKEAYTQNEKLKIEKDKLQIELDRVILELKQTKMEWALSEERKEESELSLKNEIKFLISKLIQSKGVNLNNSGIDASMYKAQSKLGSEISGSFINNSGFLNYYGGSNHNSSSIHYSSFANQIYDQNTMIINNNLGDISKVDQTLKNSHYIMDNEKKITINKGKSTFYKVKKKIECHDDDLSIETNHGDSPRKISEFYANENSILLNIKNTATHPKKLIGNLNT